MSTLIQIKLEDFLSTCSRGAGVALRLTCVNAVQATRDHACRVQSAR
jgi:hypothetical protein